MNPIKAVVSAALVVPAVLLLAFGPRGNVPVPAGRVVVDYWEKWTGSEGAQMHQIVDDFNNSVGAEKGIFVRYVTTSAINQKTLVATAAGVPPDVAGLWSANTCQFAAENALEPLEDLAAQYGITESSYKPVYWDMCKYKGHLYALVSTPYCIAMLYNKQIFHDNADALKKAGLDPDRAPRTVAELDAYADVLTKFSPTGQIERGGYLPMEPGWYVNFTYIWWGGHIWDAAHEKFTLTDPAVVNAFKWIQSYSKKLGKEAVNNFHAGAGTFDSPQNPFMASTVVMEQQGPWMANFFMNQKPSMSTVLWPKDVEMTKPLSERVKNYTWAVAPFPSADGRPLVSFCDDDTLVIPRGAKHKKEAFEFIAYVNRQNVMEKLCRLQCKCTPLAKVSDDFLEHHPNPYIKVFDDLAASPNAQPVPKVPILPQVTDALTTMAQRLALMEVTPERALQEVQDHMQHEYDLFKAEQVARGNVN